MSSLRPSSPVSQITGALATATASTSASGSTWPCPRCSWRSRPEPGGVLGVVAVHEVDAAGDGEDALGGSDHLLAGGVGVAGVEAEPDAEVGDGSQSRAMSKWRAMAWSPPAVFSR